MFKDICSGLISLPAKVAAMPSRFISVSTAHATLVQHGHRRITEVRLAIGWRHSIMAQPDAKMCI